MGEDKIRQQARKLINEKYPYLPFEQWGYFEDMFINGWKQALSIANVSQQRELLINYSNYLCKEYFDRHLEPDSYDVDEYIKSINCG